SAPRSRQKHARVMPVDMDLGFHALQKLQGLLRLFGFVALVILPENLVGRKIDDHGFHGGGTDIQADEKLRLVVMRLFGMLRLLDGRLRFERCDLNQGGTFVIVTVHDSSQKSQNLKPRSSEKIPNGRRETATALRVVCG